VEKYQLEQEIVARKKAAAIVVERYLEEQAISAKEKSENDAKAAEIAQRELRLAESLLELDEESDKALSSVARYVKNQAALEKDKTPVTGVDKYLATKIVEASKKPVSSSVEKYLVNQAIAAKAESPVSGVEKYLQKQAIESKAAPAVSRVARYVSNKTIADKYKPEVSGVAKYIAGVRAAMDAAASVVEKCLEGEFIPAGSNAGETSVDRYLEEKGISAEESKLSGVAQYLDSREEVVKEEHVTTRVETYLEEKAVVAKETALSGVEKYLAAQSLEAEKSAAEEEVLLLTQQQDEVEVVEEVLIEEPAVITGVAKYLQEKPEFEKAEVVIEVEPEAELTGVDKYMHREAVKNATGVERYLLNAAG